MRRPVHAPVPSFSPTLTTTLSLSIVIDENGTNPRVVGTGDDRETAPLRGSSTAVPGTRTAPDVASGTCVRGVTGKVELLEYTGYAGVVGGGVVPSLPPKNASSVSPTGSILLSDAGGGMPGLGGGAYVVRGAPETAAATLGGVYASFEKRPALGMMLPLLSPGDGREEGKGRGDRETLPDGGTNRLRPAMAFCGLC